MKTPSRSRLRVDEVSGGSAFCYFGPTPDFLSAMQALDWDECAILAGIQASFIHGWTQSASEAGLRGVGEHEEGTNPYVFVEDPRYLFGFPLS